MWVLNDGRREWLRDYCITKGVGWITRPGNKGAKADNINHGRVPARMVRVQGDRVRLVVKLYAKGLIRHAPRPNVWEASYSLVSRLWLARMQAPEARAEDSANGEAVPDVKLPPAQRLIPPARMATHEPERISA